MRGSFDYRLVLGKMKWIADNPCYGTSRAHFKEIRAQVSVLSVVNMTQ